MSFTTNQNTRIHYQIEGQSPPLVLQHGFIQNIKRWYMASYVDALKADYQLTLVDARGHGESDKPHNPDAYTLPLRVDGVVDILDVRTTYPKGSLYPNWQSFQSLSHSASLIANYARPQLTQSVHLQSQSGVLLVS